MGGSVGFLWWIGRATVWFLRGVVVSSGFSPCVWGCRRRWEFEVAVFLFDGLQICFP